MSCSVHDVSEYEAFGVPSVFVASKEFRSATDAQAAALGTEPAVIYVGHPIQDKSDAEIAAIADDVLDQILAALTSTQAPPAPVGP